MKEKMLSGIARFVIMTCAMVAAVAADAAAGGPKVLLVMWDGCRADALVNCKVPNIGRLAAGKWQPGYNGAWSLCGEPIRDARPYSFSNHASILTGVSAAKHNVYFNYQHARCNVERWPTFLSRLLDAKPQLKACYLYGCGVYNWNLCRDERVMHETFGIKVLEECGHLAKLYAGPDAPDAAVLFIDQPDAAGHAKGFYPTSPEYVAAVEECDVGLGKVLDAIAARPSFKDEDWLIMMIADHGGYANMHGWRDTHSRTLPVVIAGKRVINGQLAGFPSVLDLPVTALEHFGVKTAGMELDGAVIGGKAANWKGGSEIGQDLVWYFPLTVKRKFLVNAVEGGPGAVNIGDEEYFNPNRFISHFSKDKPCLWVGGCAGTVVGAYLEDSVDMFMRPRQSFALTCWVRTSVAAEGEPCIIANKDMSRPGSPGFAMTCGDSTERAPKGMCLKFGTPQGKDVKIGTFNVEDGKWSFYAIVFTPERQAWFFQGRSDGKLHWVCERAENALVSSGLPIHIGQDGTGGYHWNYSNGLDDIAVWKRALSVAEIKLIFDAGLKERKQIKDLLKGELKAGAEADFLDTTKKAGL